MMRHCCALWFCFVLVGCGGDDPTDAGADAGSPIDAGLDAGSDAGSDAGPPRTDAGPPPGETISGNVCDTAGALALATDGSRAAFVTCGLDVAVWLVDLPDGTPVRVDDVSRETRVVFSPDSAWLAWGDPSGWSIQDVAMTAGAIDVAAGTIDELRFITIDPTGTPTIRLLTLATDGATRRVTMRNDGDLFAASIILLEDPSIVGSLALVSGSRSSLIIQTDDGSTQAYHLLDTDGAGTPSMLPIDPDTFVLGPVGMGDTHTIAQRDLGLTFIEFATATDVTLETEGVFATTPLLVIVDPVDGKYAYYIRDGDPTRRLRNGTAPAETLATTETFDMWATPNEATLLFPSGGRVFSVGIDASDMTDLGPYSGTMLDGAIRQSSTELALIDSGAIRRFVPGSADSDAMLDDTGVVAGSAGYDALGDRLLWQRDNDGGELVDVLRAAPVGVDTPETVAWDVGAWWAVPTSAQLLYRTTSGALNRL